MTTSGGCLCGGVRFTITGPLREILICHCSLCRRAGTHTGAYTWVPDGALALDTAETLRTYVDVNNRERRFCGRCGSPLFWARADGNGISVSAGALDGDPPLRVAKHIFLDDAAGWEQPPR